MDANTQFIQEAIQRLRKKRERVTIVLEFDALFALLGHLQLALKHPQNVGPSANLMRRMVKDIYEDIAQDEPRLVELLYGQADGTVKSTGQVQQYGHDDLPAVPVPKLPPWWKKKRRR